MDSNTDIVITITTTTTTKIKKSPFLEEDDDSHSFTEEFKNYILDHPKMCVIGCRVVAATSSTPRKIVSYIQFDSTLDLDAFILECPYDLSQIEITLCSPDATPDPFLSHIPE
jgi:hypothetical protein